MSTGDNLEPNTTPSPTPETDATTHAKITGYTKGTWFDADYVTADFSRNLERERDEARRERDEAKAELAELFAHYQKVSANLAAASARVAQLEAK